MSTNEDTGEDSGSVSGDGSGPRASADDTWAMDAPVGRAPAAGSSGGSSGSSGGTWGREDSAGRSEPSPVPLSGRTMGRYELVRELARGGMGVVYVAWDPQLQRRVALKVLPGGSLHAQADGVERFMREARAVASLDHPGVVRVYDIGEQDDCVFFAMDLVEGGTLADRIATEGPQDPREAARLLAAISRSLAAAHARGIVHRDMKPGNVLLERDGTPRLTDFGLATQLDDVDSRLTNAGQVLGTPTHMAPEQAIGRSDRISPATDVYAVGVIAFQLLTGQLPWAERGLELVMKKPELDAVSPRSVDREIPAELATIVTKAMARDPLDRYPNATALADDLERYLRGEPIRARPPTVATRLRWLVRRNRRVLPAYAGALVGTLAMATLWWVGGAEDRREQIRQDEAAAQLARVEARMASLRAEGRDDAAEQAFRTFTMTPTVQRTEALARAWQHQAEQADTHTDRIAALARAYQESRAPALQREVLVDLAGAFRDANLTTQAVAVLDAIDRKGLTDADRAAAGAVEVQELRAWVHSADLRLDDAAAAWRALEGPDSPRGRAMAALASATWLTEECGPHFCQLWDADADGTPELAWWHDGRVSVLHLDAPDTPPASVPVAGVPTFSARRPPPDVDDQVLVHVEGGLAFEGLDAAGDPVLAPVHGVSQPTWWPRSLLRADVDRDGEVERYVGANRTLFRLDREPDGWRATEAIPGLRTANSDVTAAVHADLDGDGRGELALATAEWGTYDVRVYSGGPEPRLRGRQILGEVYGLVALPGGPPTLAALVRRVYTPQVELLPDDPVREGIALLELGTDGLAEVGWIDLDTDWFERLAAADVDGDGRTDLVAAGPGGLALLVADDDGGFDRLILDQQLFLGAVEVDGDPATELVLRDQASDRTWIAGAGDAAPPALTRVHPLPEPVPDLDDPWLESGWSPAEELVALGLGDQAADHLHRLALLAPDTPGGVQALVRSGELLASTSRWAQLGDLAATLRSWTQVPPAALRRISDLLGTAGFLEEQQATLAMVPPTPADAERRAVLSAALDGPPVEVDLGRELGPAWHVEAPELVRHDLRSGALSMAPASGEVLLALGIEIGEGPLLVDLDLALEQVEWSGLLSIDLRPLDPEGHALPAYPVAWVQVRGGQGHNHLAASVHHAELPRGTFPVEGPMDWAGRLSISLEPAQARARLRAERSDGTVAHTVAGGSATPFPPPGRYRMELSTRSEGCLGGRFVLQGLRLRGAGVALDASRDGGDAVQSRAAQLAISGWPERALELLGDRQGPAVDRVRLAALDRLGETRAARKVYARLIASRAWGATTPLALLRHAPAANAARSRSALGGAWPQAAWEAWRCSVDQAAPSAEVLRAYTADLSELGQVSPAALPDDAARLALARALVAQGRAWELQGNLARARRSLDRAEAALDALSPEAVASSGASGSADGTTVAVEARRTRSALLLERVALRAGTTAPTPETTAASLALLRAALEAGVMPERVLDRARLDPRLAGLRAHPGWEDVVDELRRGGLSP